MADFVQVYPRVYGEAYPGGHTRPCYQGLSPRVRGSRVVWAVGRRGVGSIPACTGKPLCVWRRPTRPPVYPRVYGEAADRPGGAHHSSGLSPRVRGSRRMYGPVVFSVRSIPACTGKPPVASTSGSQGMVYPRVYGEAGKCGEIRATAMGLSPRVRGSPLPLASHDFAWRSIPACTGKPQLPDYRSSRSQVYPRVYGEAPVELAISPVACGLSPRVRGSRQKPTDSASTDRSIPACTGKPVTIFISDRR